MVYLFHVPMGREQNKTRFLTGLFCPCCRQVMKSGFILFVSLRILLNHNSTQMLREDHLRFRRELLHVITERKQLLFDNFFL
jgi:hypothetical protein